MTKEKRLGVWMDHSKAHLMEFSMSPVEIKTINSKFTHQVKEDTLGKSENLMHNKEQHQQAAYNKELSELMIDYSEILLFGPTDAKAELLNLLKADHHFEKTKISVKPADKMTEIQQQTFVREYFSNHK